jgi:hypothetical protein
MKNTIILILLCAAGVIHAQSPGILYGLAQSPVNGFYLASLDPATGIVNEISTTPITGTVASCYATIDPVNDVYYFCKSDSLIGVSTNTGQVVSRVRYNLPPNYYFEMPHYNCRDSLIYGLYRNGMVNQLSMKLATIDPQNGNITIISPSSIDSGIVATTKGSLDPDAGMYFFQGINGYKGVDITTGLTVTSCIPSYTGPGNYFVLSLWDCEDSTMYGLSMDVNAGLLYPAILNIQTGVVTNTTQSGIPTQAVYMCESEINSSFGLFHYNDFNGYITVNSTTGNVLSNVPLTYSPTNGSQYFILVARDNCKCFLSPIGINEILPQTLMLRSENPVMQGGNVVIEIPAANNSRQISVTDIHGKVIQSLLLNNTQTRIEFSVEMVPGCYFIRTNNSLPVKLIVTTAD